MVLGIVSCFNDMFIIMESGTLHGWHSCFKILWVKFHSGIMNVYFGQLFNLCQNRWNMYQFILVSCCHSCLYMSEMVYIYIYMSGNGDALMVMFWWWCSDGDATVTSWRGRNGDDVLMMLERRCCLDYPSWSFHVDSVKMRTYYGHNIKTYFCINTKVTKHFD